MPRLGRDQHAGVELRIHVEARRRCGHAAVRPHRSRADAQIGLETRRFLEEAAAQEEKCILAAHGVVRVAVLVSEPAPRLADVAVSQLGTCIRVPQPALGQVRPAEVLEVQRPEEGIAVDRVLRLPEAERNGAVAGHKRHGSEHHRDEGKDAAHAVCAA